MITPFIVINRCNINITEAKMLVMTIHAKSHKEMADKLNLELNTINSYMRTLHSKLGVQCGTQLMRFCLLNGFNIDGHFKNKKLFSVDLVK